MRFAFISDIHANLDALETVFEDISTQKIDEVICLGDIVGYGANPNECVELVSRKCPLTLLGNHDAPRRLRDAIPPRFFYRLFWFVHVDRDQRSFDRGFYCQDYPPLAGDTG